MQLVAWMRWGLCLIKRGSIKRAPQKARTTLWYMDVSENSGCSPQIIHGLIGFSIINHPFWGNSPIFGNNTHISGIVLANWVIIMLPIPPIRGARKLQWSSFRLVFFGGKSSSSGGTLIPLNVRGNLRVHYLPPTHPKKWGHIKGVLTPIIPYQGLTSGPLLLVNGVFHRYCCRYCTYITGLKFSWGLLTRVFSYPIVMEWR